METIVVSSATRQQEQDLFRTISLTAFLTGTLAISAAIVIFYLEKSSYPGPLFRYISSGVFGKEAFAGETLMIIWGIVFHYMIAFLFNAFLFLLYPLISKWIPNKFLLAIIYGLFIWTVMNGVVLPLSKVNPAPFDPRQEGIAALILTLMIGLPTALIAHRYYGWKKSA